MMRTEKRSSFEYLHLATITWLTMMAIFLTGRLIFLVSYIDDAPWADNILELGRVLLLAERMDIVVATTLILPLILMWLIGSTWTRSLRYLPPAKWFAGTALMVCVTASVVAHYFFAYYKDRFNTFFWEFWRNGENARLVLWSLPDEVPLMQALGLFVALMGLGVALFIGLKRYVGRNRKHDPHKRPSLSFVFAVLLFTLLGMRGTFDPLPLPKQSIRGLVSPVTSFNALHGNPIWDIYISHKNLPDTSDSQQWAKTLTKSKAISDFESLRADWPSHHLNDSQPGFVSVDYDLPGRAQETLKRQPKHIVLVFMESFVSWVMDTEEENFGPNVAPVFRRLRQQGLYFPNYFQVGLGTLDNLTKVAYQIPTPMGFPEPTGFSIANQSYGTSLPHLMQNYGYESKFYYGGSLSWHNIGYVFKNLGFTDQIGENRIIGSEKTRFGVFDDDLFRTLEADLAKATKPTFNLVMTLSNHPPYRMPQGLNLPFQPVMPKVFKTRLSDPENFIGRYSAYHYADYALGQFLERFEKTPEFKDTLFIFTADHASDGSFRFSPEQYLHKRNIPMLIYAPDLLRLPPQEIPWHGTHMDLGATIVSMLETENRKITSFGRSLLVPPDNPGDPLFGADLSCYYDICSIQFQSYRVSNDQNLVPCSDKDCRQKMEHLTQLRDSYDRLGTHYLFNFSSKN